MCQVVTLMRQALIFMRQVVVFIRQVLIFIEIRLFIFFVIRDLIIFGIRFNDYYSSQQMQ